MTQEQRATFNLDRMGISSLVSQQFAAETLVRGFTEFREYYVESEAKVQAAVKAAGEAQVVKHYQDVRCPSEENYYFDYGSALVYFSHYADYSFQINASAETGAAADELIQRFVKALPKIKHVDPDVVPVNFWAMTRQGVMSRTRKIGAPAWDDIWMNYAWKARRGLDVVMNMTPPMDAGKLLLWHGEPGTGKSYGIRSLMRAWRKWCRAHYIVDPEKFFGEADYMLSVILDQTEDAEAYEAPVSVSGDPKAPIEAERPWHLLVMEDSDEFLQADAKNRQGQSLSRLLNMADGLIGQGLNLLVLITTNEPLGKIHPAIQREGRCMANVEFSRLNIDEVSEWIEVHRVTDFGVKEDNLRLSDLYARARSRAQVKETADKRKVGFVR